MSHELRLEIEPPVHGWVTVKLTTAGVAVGFIASYTPHDSIADLTAVAAGLLVGVSDQVVVWNTEPVEYEFRFAVTGGQTRLTVIEYPDRRRGWRRTEEPMAVVEGDTVAFARAIWRGLRRLEGMAPAEAFAAAWGHPFPTNAVEHLGEQLCGQNIPGASC